MGFALQNWKSPAGVALSDMPIGVTSVDVEYTFGTYCGAFSEKQTSSLNLDRLTVWLNRS
jgi:hypothetical protein